MARVIRAARGLCAMGAFALQYVFFAPLARIVRSKAAREEL
ncbi:MAG: hypothetical protein ACXIVE_02635 [Salinarimonas sp.]